MNPAAAPYSILTRGTKAAAKYLTGAEIFGILVVGYLSYLGSDDSQSQKSWIRRPESGESGKEARMLVVMTCRCYYHAPTDTHTLRAVIRIIDSERGC
ncbi:hypothetical protein ARMSODRAFT_515260 [Armillaria solidipes]|uniref:Uncharacterized protein n=1 Tax=Armillaria solidipes TaxID=1076256 RepID=A0A2H3AZC3_9AGAR|nr:hypothetical protein ARMSODRAFT_515260 [Armillaria solidipes]